MPPAGITAGLLLMLALYCATDPFKQGALSEFPDFEALKVDLPHGSQVSAEEDDKDLLQSSEIRFLGQVQGPESMAFDNLGRGPYTGIADGRIVFWNGYSWTDFAYTSNNRLVLGTWVLFLMLQI